MYQSILLIEDDKITSRIISSKLEKKGFVVYQVYNGEAVKKSVLRNTPDCIILDIGLPRTTGYIVFKSLKNYYKGPIVFFTGDKSESVEALSLKLGVDDFVSKNKSFNVLYQRVSRLIKAPSNQVAQLKSNYTIKIGDFFFNKKYFQCFYNNKEILLTNDEYELLYFLLIFKDRLLTRNDLYLALKGVSYDGMSRSIDVAISRLKDKLCNAGINKKIISTKRGKGYLFNTKELLVFDNTNQNDAILSINEKEYISSVLKSPW